jgi:hypothetical protein
MAERPATFSPAPWGRRMRSSPETQPMPQRREENFDIWREEITVPTASGRAGAER